MEVFEYVDSRLVAMTGVFHFRDSFQGLPYIVDQKEDSETSLVDDRMKSPDPPKSPHYVFNEQTNVDNATTNEWLIEDGRVLGREVSEINKARWTRMRVGTEKSLPGSTRARCRREGVSPPPKHGLPQATWGGLLLLLTLVDTSSCP